MAERKHRVSIVGLVVALLIAGVLSAWVYFFFLQTPILSRREPFFGLVLFICFVPALYFLITRFLAGALARYTSRGKAGFLLLSALIGFFAVLITLKVPYFIRALPSGSPLRSGILVSVSLGRRVNGSEPTADWYIPVLFPPNFNGREDRGMSFSSCSSETHQRGN
jgi:hypothetical protein